MRIAIDYQIFIKNYYMNNMKQTVGQAEAWRIAIEVLKEFSIDLVNTSLTLEKKAYNASVYDILLARLRDNQVIMHDRYTGCRITKKEVANSYVNWLSSKSIGREITPLEEVMPINFNRMVFGGSLFGEYHHNLKVRVYEGGVEETLKMHTMPRAVLTLVKGDDLYKKSMDITYYINSQIMVIAEGNHRLLAYKLLGIISYPAAQLRVYDDPNNEQLNKALICLESLYDITMADETKIVVGDNEKFIIQLAADYGAFSIGRRDNELYRFTKRDFPKHRQNIQKTFINILSDYREAYNQLSNTKSWVKNLFSSKPSKIKLSNEQEEIQTRLSDFIEEGRHRR